MKRRSSFRCILLFGVLTLTLTVSKGQTNTIVVPKGAEMVFGDGGVDPFFLNIGPVQQVYGSSEFSDVSTETLTITGLAFRASSMDAVVSRVRMRMGVFEGALDEVSTDFAANLRNPVTVFDMDQVHLKAEGGQPPAVFDVEFKFEMPFIYDRRRGQLVLEILALHPYSGSIAGVDAHSAFNQGVYVYYEPMGSSKKMSVMMATKFFYLAKSAIISSIQLNTDRVEIEFVVSGPPGVIIEVQGAAGIEGPFTTEKDALIMAVPGDKFQATVPLSEPAPDRRFFRISLQ